MINNKELDDLSTAIDKIELKLLDGHVHFLTGELNEENIKRAAQWIVYENLEKTKNKQLTLYINSPGGDLYESLALIDMMNKSEYTISTIGIGQIMSAAFLIFASGSKGHRYIAQNTGIMCHQLSTGGDSSKYHDVKASMIETELCNGRMMKILRDTSGLENRYIKTKLLGPSDTFFTADELVALGIADHIL